MKKIRLIGALLILTFFVSGCYNYRELNDLGITTAVSIDFDKENNLFIIDAQLINPVKQQDVSASGEPTFLNFTSSDKSLQETFRKMILESPRQLYGSHMQFILLSEVVAEEHLPEVLDFFIRDPELRSEFKIIIAQDSKALKSISIQTLLDDLSASNILSSLEKQKEKLGNTVVYTLNDIANMYLNPYLEITLPSLKVEGDIEEGEDRENVTETVQKASVKIGTTAIFKDNKLLEYLDSDKSKMFSLIKGELTDTVLRVDIDDGYIVFQPNRLKTETKALVKENKVKINIEGFAQINEVDVSVNLKSPKEIDHIQKKLNEEIEREIINTFEYIRGKYNTDVFGFRDLYYKTDYKYFKKHYQNWYEEVFPKLEIEVKSNLKLYEKGNAVGGIIYEREN